MGAPFDVSFRNWHVIARQTKEVAYASSTAENTLFSFVIPKAWMTLPEVVFRVKAYGLIKQTQTANDFTFKAKLGSTAICTAISEVAAIADEGSFAFELFMNCGIGTAQDWTFSMIESRGKASVAEGILWVNRGTGSVDMTAADQTFTITSTFETNHSGVYLKLEELYMEMLMPESRPA